MNCPTRYCRVGREYVVIVFKFSILAIINIQLLFLYSTSNYDCCQDTYSASIACSFFTMVQRTSSAGRAKPMSSKQAHQEDHQLQHTPTVLDSFWKAMETNPRSNGDDDDDDESYLSDRGDGVDAARSRRSLGKSVRKSGKGSIRRFSIKNRKNKPSLESREASNSRRTGGRRGKNTKMNSLVDALSDDDSDGGSAYTGRSGNSSSQDNDEEGADTGILGWLGFGASENDRDDVYSDYADSYDGSSASNILSGESGASEGPDIDDLTLGSSDSFSDDTDDTDSEDDMQSRSKKAGFLPHSLNCRSPKNNNPFRQRRDTRDDDTDLNPTSINDSRSSSYSELLYTKRRSDGKDRGQFLSRFADKHALAGEQLGSSNAPENQFSLKQAMRTQSLTNKRTSSFSDIVGSGGGGSGGKSTPTTPIQLKQNSTMTKKEENPMYSQRICGDDAFEDAFAAATTFGSSANAPPPIKITESSRNRSFGSKKNDSRSSPIVQEKEIVPSSPDRSGGAKMLFCRKNPGSPQSVSTENKLEKYTRKKETSDDIADKTKTKSNRKEQSPKSRKGARAFMKRAICRSFRQPYGIDGDGFGLSDQEKNSKGPDVMVKMVPDFDDTVIPGSGPSLIPVDGNGGSGGAGNGGVRSDGTAADHLGPSMMLPEDDRLSALKGPQSMLVYENDVCNHMDIAYKSLTSENSHSTVQMRKHNMPPIVQPKSEEVVIQVEASTICYHDCIIRRGQWWCNTQVPLPYIPGGDIVGKIHHLDPKVSAYMKMYPGDRVLSFIKWGGNARYATALAEDLVPVPKSVDAAAACCLVGSYLSAFQSLHIGQKNATRYKKASLKNKRIMVVGAMTCTGKAVVELAMAGGAQTVFTTSKKKHQDHLRSMGATTLDRKPDNLAELTGGNIDLILVTDGRDIGLLNLFDCLNVAGHIVFIGRRASDEQYQSSVFVDPNKMVEVMARTHVFDVFEAWERNKKNCKRDLKFLIQLLDKKVVKPFVLDRIPLDRVGRAHDMLEQKRFPGYLVCEPWVKEKHRAAFL